MEILKGTYRLLKQIVSFYQTSKYPNCHKTASIPRSTHVYNKENIVLAERVSIGPNSEIMNPRAKFIMKKGQ